MGTRGELFSTRILVGKRTYFFNIKENLQGDLFLNIVESKKNGEHNFERRSVIVFQEDLDSFLEGLSKALDFFQEQGIHLKRKLSR